MAQEKALKAGRHVALGTVSFAICFAAWGLIGAFAPQFRKMYDLTQTQTALLVAVPVLLGSLARIPMGMLTDKFGARVVYTALMLFVPIPALLVPHVQTFHQLLLAAFFLGMAGSAFAVGVPYVSRWSPADEQGKALGIYGLGNIGQSAAVFLGPLLASLPAVGWQNVFRIMALLSFIGAMEFAILGRNPVAARPKGIGEMLHVMTREPLAWGLAAFYFLTFGGFVAFAIYLPTLLRNEFGLAAVDAGFRTAGFVVVATLLRPAGGWLADKIGGSRVLAGVFLGVMAFALLLMWRSMVPFTVGMLGCAALLGIGNGAVFKLVPQYFPKETGTVGGLVGAMGGLGGFFPPLLLGICRDRLGVIWPGFALLSVISGALWLLNQRVFIPQREAIELALPPELGRTVDRLRAAAWATMWTGLLVAAIVVGSRNLQNFDAALVIYTFATIFAVWAVSYHYYVWLQKPPMKVYWRRARQVVRELGGLNSARRLMMVAGTHLVAQRFIAHRSRLRWWMHQCLFWGCIIAGAVTFPLVFGWIHFRSLPNDQMTYVTYVFGFPTHQFRLRTLESWMTFHALDFAAVLVLAGIALALWRRLRDKGAQAVQSFTMDFFPLIILFAISVTGLALTVSSLWLGGALYQFLAIVHSITVITALLSIPFGKFFHIFQRPTQLAVKLYQQAGDAGPGAHCARCGERFASRMHVDDLKTVLPQVGFNYRMPGPAGHWQELCPPCKRKSLATAQLRMKEQARG